MSTSTLTNLSAGENLHLHEEEEEEDDSLNIRVVILLCLSFFFILAVVLYFRRLILLRLRTEHVRGVADAMDGLDAHAIAVIPAFPGGHGDADECAVCLGAVKEGEVVRKLPNCLHLFHLRCIDTWLRSHSTCPLCRAAATVVEEEGGSVSGDEQRRA